MKRHMTVTALLLALIGLAGLLPASALAQPFVVGRNLNNIPVTGTLSDDGTFTGTMKILGVGINDNNRLTVSGVLNGQATDSSGVVTDIVNQAFTVIARLTERPGAHCDILRLALRPIDLDVLGLQVHLDRVLLDIDAVPGPGNLLGNLLCALAGLLD